MTRPPRPDLEIVTSASDSRAEDLCCFLESVREHAPDSPIAIVPFAEDIAETTRIASFYGARMLQADPFWDDFGKRLYGDEIYRPGLTRAAYFRKLNMFNAQRSWRLYCDANSVLVSDPAELMERTDHQALFHSSAIRNRNFSPEGEFITRMDPEIRAGFNLGFCLFSPFAARRVRSFAELVPASHRQFLGPAPEQAFLCYALAFTGVAANLCSAIDADIAPTNNGDMEIRPDAQGAQRYTAGPFAGRRVISIKRSAVSQSDVNSCHFETFAARAAERFATGAAVAAPAPALATASRPEAGRIFICGCPRSGTTALWNMMTRDSRIVMGVERYGNRFFHKDFLTDAHFTEERFYRIEKGDTFYDDLDGFSPYYSESRPRFADALYVGDKIPKLYMYLGRVAERFPDARVLMIFRNIFDVAASYKARARNKQDTTWPATMGVKAAVEDWSRAIAACRANRYRMNILPLDYEKLFFQGAELDRITDFLGLETGKALLDAQKGAVARSRQIEGERRRDLTAAEVKYISMQADFEGYRDVLRGA